MELMKKFEKLHAVSNYLTHKLLVASACKSYNVQGGALYDCIGVSQGSAATGVVVSPMSTLLPARKLVTVSSQGAEIQPCSSNRA